MKTDSDLPLAGFSAKGIGQAAILSFSLFLALVVPVSYGAESFTGMQVVAILCIAIMSVACGKSLSHFLRFPPIDGFLNGTEIVSGFSVLSVVHLFVTLAFKLGAGGALICDVLIVTAAGLVVAWNQQNASEAARCNWPRLSWRSTAIDCCIIILLGLITTLWVREALISVAEAKQTGIFRVWSDFLLQAAEINYQINYQMANGESQYLAGFPQAFYHRASYSIAAVYGWITGDLTLGVATYFWLPTGLILMGIGAYSLGTVLGGRAVGVFSALALFLLPDASMYGLENGYFAFYWLLAVAPGAGYALALSFVALAFYFLGVIQKDYRLVIIGAGAALLGAVFRIHIAIPLAALFVVLSITSLRLRPWHRVLVIGALPIAIPGIALLFESITFAPHFFTGRTEGLQYIEAVHAATPTAYEGVFYRVTSGLDPFWRGAVGYVLLMVAQYGLVLPIFLGGLVFLREKRFKWHLFAISFGLVLVHALITFLMPTASNGDITEWSHRSFVLIYSVLLISSVAVIALSRPMEKLTLSLSGTPVLKAAIVSSLFLSGLLVPWFYGKNLQYGSLRDGPSACATQISPEMFAVTEFIRKNANPGDKILASDGDPAAVVVALTGLQAYVSRGALYQKVGGSAKALTEARLEELYVVRNATEYHDLVEFGRRSGVRWFLAIGRDVSGASEALIHDAAFARGTIAVFDLYKSSKAKPGHSGRRQLVWPVDDNYLGWQDLNRECSEARVTVIS